MKRLKFSSRTPGYLRRNRLSVEVDRMRERGESIIDLTESNPTQVGIDYPAQIPEALNDAEALSYRPDPKGLLSAREAVAGYYAGRGARVDPEDIFLTSGTSESYSLLFKLLLEPGETVISPTPGYPLVPLLARAEGLRWRPWPFHFDGKWHPRAAPEMVHPRARVRLAVVVHPNNPTGAYLKQAEWLELRRAQRRRGWALLCDEVFFDYRIGTGSSAEEERSAIGDPRPCADGALSRSGESGGVTPGGQEAFDSLEETDAPFFVLSGLSKTAGLPQMKLGWILIRGEESQKKRIRRRLEFLCDAYLSTGTPVQLAAPRLFEWGQLIRRRLLERARENHGAALRLLESGAAEVIPVEGGWSAVIRLPETRSDEEWCLDLLKRQNVLAHPGFFYEFSEGCFLVISLIVEPNLFLEGMNGIRGAAEG